MRASKSTAILFLITYIKECNLTEMVVVAKYSHSIGNTLPANRIGTLFWRAYCSNISPKELEIVKKKKTKKLLACINITD